MNTFWHQWRFWLLLAVLLLIGAFLGWGLQISHARIYAHELERLDAQGRVIEVNLLRQLTAINQSLLSIQKALPLWQKSPAGREYGQQTLLSMDQAMPAVRTIGALDAQGRVIFSNRDELLGRNFFERDYIQVPLKTLDPDLLYVSPPYQSVLKQYVISLTRVLLDNKGQFAGVVLATLDPMDFAILLESVRYKDDMQVLLLHGNGELFLSDPPQDPRQAQALLADDAPWYPHLQARPTPDQAHRMATFSTDQRLGVVRTIAMPQLAMDQPLAVVLSRARQPLYTDWSRDVLIQVSAYLLLVLVSFAGFSLFQGQRTQKIVAAKRLKLATEAGGVGIWEFDLISKNYQWDNTMFELFGIDPKTASPRNDDWIKLLSPQELQRMRDATRATIRDNQPFGMTFQITRPDGQVRFMRNRAALYSDDQGVPHRLIGSTVDVTRHKQQEADLRVAAAAFESHESMLVADAQANILRVNRAFTQLFGYAANEVVGQNPRLLKSGRQEADFYQAMWSELAQHHSWQGEIWNTRKDGVEFPCWLCITAVCDEAGAVTHYVATHTDITLRKLAEDEVKQLAFFDPLTNLPNRRLLSDRLHQAMTKAKRELDHMALIYIDLDKFKPVNDQHGHAAGDQLLQAVAHRLKACVRESDTVARVGGDEFVVLLTRIHQAQDALQVAEKMQEALRAPFHLPTGQSLHISSSVGIALYPEHGLDEATLSHHADVAMYAAKAAGRDQYLVYEHGLDHGREAST